MHQIDIKDNMLLICPSDIKEKILTNNKSLVDISFMTLEEYKKRYYFDYDYHTVKYLMDTYGYTLNNAKEIIESLYFVEDKDYPNNNLNDFYGNGIILKRCAFSRVDENYLTDCSASGMASIDTDYQGDGNTAFLSFSIKG